MICSIRRIVSVIGRNSEEEEEEERTRSVILCLRNWLCNKNGGYKLIIRGSNSQLGLIRRAALERGRNVLYTSFIGSSRDRVRRRQCLVFLTRGRPASQPADQPACHLPKDNNVVILPWDTDEVLNNPINPRYILHINIYWGRHAAAIYVYTRDISR